MNSSNSHVTNHFDQFDTFPVKTETQRPRLGTVIGRCPVHLFVRPSVSPYVHNSSNIFSS